MQIKKRMCNLRKKLRLTRRELSEFCNKLGIENKEVEVRLHKERSNAFILNNKSAYEILTNKVLSKKMMPIMFKINPGGKIVQEKEKAGIEKFIYIIKGEIKVVIGGKDYELNKGDSLYFEASLPHFYKNRSKSVVQFISVISPPVL